MSHAFDQLLRGSPVFPVASGLHGMGRWGWHREWDTKTTREIRAPVAGEVVRMLS